MSDKEEESSGALGDALKAAVAEAELKTKPEEVSGAVAKSEDDIQNKPETSLGDDKPKLDELGRAYATGKRKNAVARVWLKRGSGRVTVNGKDGPSYFARPVLQMIINQPLQVVDRATQYDIWCTVSGGGLSGQAGAVRHGISRALTYFEPSLRALLKPGGFLTRDSRSVERKKYGKRKARRSFQFSKR